MNCLKPCVLIALGMSTASAASQPHAAVPPEARAAAEIGLYSWTNDFIKDGAPPGQDFVFDVETLQQLKSARLGRGFAMKTVDPARLMAGASLREATDAPGEWRFVVLVDEDPVGLVDVRRVAGQYQLVGLGGKALARHVETVLAPYPGRASSLVRSHQARADYMELSADAASGTQYAPLLAARLGQVSARGVEGHGHRATAGAGLLEESALAAELRDAIAHGAGSTED